MRWLSVCFCFCLVITSVHAQVVPVVPRSNTYMADSPAAAELLEDAQRLLDQGQTVDAVERLQEIVETYPDRLLETAGQYTDARLIVWQTIQRSSELQTHYEERYGSLAKRQREQALLPTINIVKLGRVSQLFFMTEAGLAATLDRAAWHLAHGQFHDARQLLKDAEAHPAIQQPTMTRRHALMLAYTLAAQADTNVNTQAQAQAAIQRYQRAGGDASTPQADIKGLIQQANLLRNERPDPWPKDQAMPSMTRPSWQQPAPIWTFEENPDRDNRPRARRSNNQQPVSRPVTVTASEDLLFIHDGLSVSAWDRSSGQSIWKQDSSLPRHMARWPVNQIAMQLRGMGHRHVIADDDRVYAVVGWAGGRSRGFYGGVSPAIMMAFDAQTGEELWATQAQQVDPSLNQATFTGTARVHGDYLFTLISRMQSGGFNELYLAALSPETGEPIWHRHIASSSPHAGRGGESMIYSDGLIYVSNGRGVIASLNATDGSLKWARLFNPENQPAHQTHNMRWMYRQPELRSPITPIRTVAGLLVPTTWDYERVGLIRMDPDSGQVLNKRLPEVGQSVITMSILNNGDVLVLDHLDGLKRIDGQTLETRWTIEIDDVHQDASLATLGRMAALTTRSQLMLIDLETGETIEQLPLTAAGRVALGPGQLILTQDDTISSYMAWALAKERLARQMQSRPNDPQPGLAMARMAFNENELPSLTGGLDHAIRAAQQARTEQDMSVPARVFEDMLKLASDWSVSEDPGLAQAVFDRLPKVADTVDQRVAVHLTQGEFESRSNQPRQAVASYQAILLSPELAQQRVDAQQVVRPAGVLATQRLQRLIDKHGRGIYETFEAQAASELVKAASDVQRLAMVAEQFPMARSAVLAMSQAGDVYVQRGALQQAAHASRIGLRLEPDEAMQRSLASRMISAYEQAGHVKQAVYWLRRLQRTNPQIILQRQSQAIAPSAWLAQLDSPSRPAAMPSVRLPFKQTLELIGQLQMPLVQPSPHATRLGNLVLLRTGDALTMHDAQTGEALWTLQRPDALLLLMDDSQVLLWIPEQRAIEAIDPQTGQSLWPVVSVGGALADIQPMGLQGNAQSKDDRMPEQWQAHRQMVAVRSPEMGVATAPAWSDMVLTMTDHLFAISDLTLATCDAQGRALLVDRMTGEIRWQIATSIKQPTAMAISDELVAITGHQTWDDPQINPNENDGERQGGIIALDIHNGDQRLTSLNHRAAPFFVGFHGDGSMIVADPLDIFALSADSGDILWRNERTQFPLSPRAWLMQDSLVIVENQGTLGLIDVNTGIGQQRMSLQFHNRQNLSSLTMRWADGVWFAQMSRRIVAIEEDGQVKWQDGLLHDQRVNTAALLADRENLFAVQQRFDNLGRRLFEGFILDSQTGLAHSHFKLDKLNTGNPSRGQTQQRMPLHSAWVENGLVFGVGENVIILRGSEP